MRRLAALAVCACATFFLGAAPAQAAECSTRNPGTAVLNDPRDGPIPLNSGTDSARTYLFEYSVTGCEPKIGEQTATIHGLDLDRGVTAKVVTKGPKAVSLVVDFGSTSLPPGLYDFTVASDDFTVPIRQTVSAEVKNSSTLPWLWVGAAIAIGVVILAWRAAAAANKGFKAIPKYFTPAVTAPILAGVFLSWPIINTQWLSKTAWYGDASQTGELFFAVLAAFVASGTVVTAATKLGSKIPESGK